MQKITMTIKNLKHAICSKAVRRRKLFVVPKVCIYLHSLGWQTLSSNEEATAAAGLRCMVEIPEGECG